MEALELGGPAKLNCLSGLNLEMGPTRVGLVGRSALG